ncbi:XRE family transcriptional regulator [Paenibacillus sp. 28ISP30-2]|uniref:helix-turn-helix domain-containing protein n=1 Tax=unclassified Paenibacillus TaxID=185978 RepID=UPI00071F99F1|nr:MULTISPECIES: helix-turn-helix transcriptional regulator [unclassified Paenibacillus]ALP38271.1 DNA-binding protein [Paenibacillus sp. IHB B 3084]MBE0337170.1 XRE family transcriptional regulator [Paenibacillus sp. 23TSA30-6]MBE0341998.1 XRE family transcriptional regulator [Paenibacillus sp. 28ISP30-2]
MLKIRIKLKQVLKEKGITQKQLEELSGVSQARISKLSSDDRQEVNLLMLEKIAHALEIKDISVLMQFEETE